MSTQRIAWLRSAGLAAGLLALAGCMGAPQEGAAGSAAFWSCPDGYQVKEGLNTGFPSRGLTRAFIVVPPRGAAGPAPVWIPTSGTVESANANLFTQRSGNNAKLAEHGFMVIGPVRQCAGENPDIGFGECDGPGSDGWNWKPWNDGRAASPEGEKWKTDAGPDSQFFEEMIRCVGTKYPLDAKRLYLGGISAGGTLTNRVLTYNSDFWAGGMPLSGEWYVTKDDGSPLAFKDAVEAVRAAPAKVHQGRIGPHPLPAKLDPMVVITMWGGATDTYDCGPPIGYCADYRPSTQAGANYFSSHANVVHVACSGTHGHRWPSVNRDAFNLWALQTLASHPKGTDPKKFKLTPPPEGYACRVGTFTDHY